MSTNASSSVTIRKWLDEATSKLQMHGVTTSRLDCLVLLEDCLGHDRAHILAHPDSNLAVDQLQTLDSQLQRRLHHEPLAYIRGKTDFYGRTFVVTNHTLEPRPETETLIEMAIKLPLTDFTVVDVGTGSGCIAITLQMEIPSLTTYGVDIDTNCIQVAINNAAAHRTNTNFIQSDLLSTFNLDLLTSRNLAIVANLPYVPTSYHINEAATYEPRHAIYGGVDGLELYRHLFAQAHQLKLPVKYILTESLPFQHEEMATIAQNDGYKLITTDDFIQCFVRLERLP